MSCSPKLTQWLINAQTIPDLNGYLFGKINPTFSDKPIFIETLK